MKYKLSPEEIKTINTPLQEITKQQQLIGFFLGHLTRTNNLPEIVGGYTLSQDQTEIVPLIKQEDGSNV